VEVPGTIQRMKSSVSISAKFPVKLTYHNIKIPELRCQKFAEQVEVNSEFALLLK
jgi:hypothetical protein